MSKVQYKSNKKAVDTELARLFSMTLTGAGEIVRSNAVQLSPKDTGRLQNSIDYQVNPFEREVIIGTPVEYGIYQELGTSRMGAKPFLKPGMLMSANAINQLAKKIFGGGFK